MRRIAELTGARLTMISVGPARGQTHHDLADMNPSLKAVPRHVAIIMDGNGRWAKERGLPRIKGHEKGADAVRACVEGCGDLQIEFLTLYAFSAENWQRPKSRSFCPDEAARALPEGEDARTAWKKMSDLQAIGRLTDLPEACQKQLHKSIEQTRKQQRADPDPGAQLWRTAGDHRRDQESLSSRSSSGTSTGP